MSASSFDNFLSPFFWRYGSDEMRALWSEAYKRRLWRGIWVALAEAQKGAGLAPLIRRTIKPSAIGR